MKKYSSCTVLQKEAATSPDPDRQPPRMMIGRLPYLFTRMLLIGPVEKKNRAVRKAALSNTEYSRYAGIHLHHLSHFSHLVCE